MRREILDEIILLLMSKDIFAYYNYEHNSHIKIKTYNSPTMNYKGNLIEVPLDLFIELGANAEFYNAMLNCHKCDIAEAWTLWTTPLGRSIISAARVRLEWE